jgi:thiol-disulfide isomerase/thioredoxin
MKTTVKICLILVLFGFSLSGCNTDKIETPKLSYQDSTLIEIRASNVSDTLNINTQFCSLFPFRPCLRNNLEVTKSGIYYIAYRLTKPELIKFDIGESFQALLMPGDTLTINVTYDNGSNNNKKISYTIDDDFYDYFRAKKDKFGYYDLEDARNNIVKTYFSKLSISGDSFSEALNILAKEEKQNFEFLSEHGRNLPDWFLDYEKANITYGSAHTKLLLYDRLSTEDKQSIEFPNIQFVNTGAYLSTFYYYFIYDYLNFIYPKKDINSSGIIWKVDQMRKSTHFLDSILIGESRAYYNTVSLADLYFFSSSREDMNTADSFVNENLANLDEKEKAFIDYDKKETAMFLKIKDNLPSGDAAPKFYLKSQDGMAYQMKDFSGKIIYLHFWATWCAPCIQEMPALNQLKSKFQNQPFELVNICMDNNPEKWMEIIGREKLEGINLICKGSWDKSLSEQYFIDGLPHYSIIDQKGKILQNNCGGPEAVYSDLVSYLNMN